MYFQPVGAPARSAIGRALAGGIERVGQGFAQREEDIREDEEYDRQLRAAGIVDSSDLQRRSRMVTGPGRNVVALPPKEGPISRAATGYMSAPVEGPEGTPVPRIELAKPAAPATTARMAGPVRRVEDVEEHYDMGGGKVYAPGRDREAVISSARAGMKADAELAAQERVRRQILPAAERVRSGNYTANDVLALTAAGVKLSDLEDPESAINRAVDRERRIVTAREEAQQPFEEAARAARSAEEQAEWDRRHRITTSSQREGEENRARLVRERQEAGGGNTGGSINYKTNRRTAPLYGQALFHAQAGMAQRRGGELVGTRPMTIVEIVMELQKNPRARNMSEDEILGVAAQAYREANGMVDEDSFSPHGSSSGGLTAEEIGRVLEGI